MRPAHVFAKPAYPRAPVIAIILDNVGTHSSRAVEGWLGAHARVRLLYGARYSPHHNPVERIWGAMSGTCPTRRP